MVNPVSNAQAFDQASQISQPAARQPQPKPASAEVKDTASFKSTGNVSGDADHDGDSR
jgi:hypothetical protein